MLTRFWCRPDGPGGSWNDLLAECRDLHDHRPGHGTGHGPTDPQQPHRRARPTIAPTRAALRETFEEIAKFDELGDMHSKFEAIKESKARFAKIPEYDEASRRWAAEAKAPR